MKSPFAEMKNGVGKAAFWITGKLWLALMDALERDRVIVAAGGGIDETPTPNGRCLTVRKESIINPVTMYFNHNGVLQSYTVATIGNPTDIP